MKVENYAGAILIAYRLYKEYVGDVDFTTFEDVISERYEEVSYAVNLAIRDRRKENKEQ